MSRIQINTGNLLLAEPFMLDANFKRAAVLLCDHSEEGSLGFILNKRLQMRVDELISEFPEFSAPVYYGGPVETDTIHYLHNVGDLLENSRKVADGVWWGGSFEKLKFLISSSLVQPQNIRFYVGYSGWSEGQLEDEMKWGSWITADTHANYVFKSPPDALWSQVLANKGNAWAVIATLPEEVAWN